MGYWLHAVRSAASLVAAIAVAMLGAACGPAQPTPTRAPRYTLVPTFTPRPSHTPTLAAAVVTESARPGRGLRVGLVTDIGGIEDAGFNAAAWEGLERAAEDFGVQAQFIESQAQADYEKNITAFAEQGFDLVFTVGSLMSDATAKMASLYPDAKLAGVDQWFNPPIKNVTAVTFAVDEAAFPIGYLAAGWAVLKDPADPQIGYVGSMQIPPVEQFIVAYCTGANYFNARKGTNVQCKGIYVGDFESPDKGWVAGRSLIDEGVDVIFGVGGKTGSGGLTAAKESGKWGIGAHVDQYNTLPSEKDILITSCVKRPDNAVYAMVESLVRGTFEGSTEYVATIGNNGVGLAPYHDFEDAIPDELKKEVKTIQTEIAGGMIHTGWSAALPSDEPQAPVEIPATPSPESTPAGDLLDQVTAAGRLIVSTDPNYKPQSFLNDAGELDGFDVDVAREVAKRLGVKPEFVTPDWDMIVGGGWGSRWDLSIGSMTPTEERAQVLWLTDPYYYTPASFAVHKDNTSVTRPQDLAGQKVGVGRDTACMAYLDGALAMMGGEALYSPPANLKVVPYAADAEAIQDLALGDGTRLDAVLVAQPTLQVAIDEGQPLKYVGTPAFYQPLVFALDKGRGESDAMLARLNEIIRAMHDDGTLSRLSLKWYRIDLTTVVRPGE